MQISVLAVVSRNYSMLTSTCFTPPIINRWLGKYFWGKHVWPDFWNVCSSSLLVIYATFGKNKQIHALMLGTLNFWQNVWFYCTDTICREVNRWCNHTSWFLLLLFHEPFLFPDLLNCYIPSNTKRQYGIEFAVPSRMNVVQYGILFKYHCDYSDIAGRQTVWLVCEVLGDLSEVLWCEYAQTVWSSERSCYSISGLDLPSSLSLSLSRSPLLCLDSMDIFHISGFLSSGSRYSWVNLKSNEWESTTNIIFVFPFCSNSKIKTLR